jgi:hypothetical protein
MKRHSIVSRLNPGVFVFDLLVECLSAPENAFVPELTTISESSPKPVDVSCGMRESSRGNATDAAPGPGSSEE